MIDVDFWRGKKVFLTGNTGFKGSWLSIWLHTLGAEVKGYALEPPTSPSLFESAGIASALRHVEADIRDLARLVAEMSEFRPDIVIHMAAQPLVRESYIDPVGTYETNVMGTVNLLEAVRKTEIVRSVVIVTTDKCYENREWVWGYRENEAMGGYDPYSNSKGCAELVTSAYRSSFFNPKDYGTKHKTAVASARAGNVIGGGDWAKDRLIPDIVRALSEGREVLIRSPYAIRPWQHVLEPLSGYLTLAQKLYEEGITFAEGWNFGPEDNDAKPVEWITKKLCDLWGAGASYKIDDSPQPHEANYLKLDISKAKTRLGWRPRWDLETALDKILEWTSKRISGHSVSELCKEQIASYEIS